MTQSFSLNITYFILYYTNDLRSSKAFCIACVSDSYVLNIQVNERRVYRNCKLT